MTSTDLHAWTEIEVPARLAGRPRTRGFVVPWFVDQDEQGNWDFRLADQRKLVRAVKLKLCWLCGEPLGRWQVFVIGPMCAINRTTAEPPMHRECAEYAAAVCPFLTQREQRRRTDHLHPESIAPAGTMIARQPGVTLLWVTREGYRLFPATGGVLLKIGSPSECIWQCEGRPATRDEVLASIDSGYPLLLAEAEAEGPAAIAALQRMRAAIDPLLPNE
ncbi:MAG TPA: hypothetical protein VGJ60_07000 [Chloroflexota bacterium]|jgi:hypothetical protein